ncbi:hypothetical protein KR093_000704 [Drosophila rubida]|uniref:Luciferin 4-monooxygenase-like n=1 Tax=Drosophila rubida TaxID=30044 RepID=A0AAD4PMP7_9MUSC|nr:hypothetical protein KR093_000704 [Drosophila rubida]
MENITMKYMPEINYNSDEKIWSGVEPPAYFAEDLSIGEVIFHEMQRHPKLIAQISASENTVLTREELFSNSMRVASYLRNLKLEQSDIIGLIARNTTHIFAVAYGCFFNAMAFHSLNINFEQEKIEHLFNVTKPKIIFCDGDEYEKVKAATKQLNVRIVTMKNHKDGAITIEEVLATPVSPFFQPARPQLGSKQNLVILCSSGTTGTPKAVTLPNNPADTKMFPFVTSADVLYVPSTLDWVTGLIVTVASGIRSATRIICDKPFDPSDLLRLIKKYKVTFLMQAPPHMAQMLNCPEFNEDHLSSLLYCIYTGAGCSLEVQQSFRSKLAPKSLFAFGYSFTELCGIGSINLHFDQKPGSVGRLAGGYKLKIVNDQREALGPNQIGEINLYTGKYWAGYYGNPEETRKLRDSDLWYHSGDLGYVDDDGFLYIVDRKKDMLKYSGLMYYPHEIEKVISQMPQVAEVCVFGVVIQNEDAAAAAVVRKRGAKLEAQDVIEYVAKHVQAKHKHLHGGVFVIDDLKRTNNGKTDRRATKTYCLKVA